MADYSEASMSSVPTSSFDGSLEASSLSFEILTGALETLRSRIKALEGEVSAVSREIAKAKEEERLILKLLALREAVSENLEAQSPGDQAPRFQNGKPDTLPSAVTTILEETGRPVHISEVMRLLRERQVQIPGKGSQANLITYLRRNNRIVRPSRGMYALAEWGLPNMPVLAKRRRRRRRRKSTTAGTHGSVKSTVA